MFGRLSSLKLQLCGPVYPAATSCSGVGRVAVSTGSHVLSHCCTSSLRCTSVRPLGCPSELESRKCRKIKQKTCVQGRCGARRQPFCLWKGASCLGLPFPFGAGSRGSSYLQDLFYCQRKPCKASGAPHRLHATFAPCRCNSPGPTGKMFLRIFFVGACVHAPWCRCSVQQVHMFCMER